MTQLLYILILWSSLGFGFLVWYFPPRGGISPWFGRCSVVLGFIVLSLFIYNRVLRERPPFLLTSVFTSFWGFCLLALIPLVLILGGVSVYMRKHHLSTHFTIKDKYFSFLEYYYAGTIIEFHQWLMNLFYYYKWMCSKLTEAFPLYKPERLSKLHYIFIYIPVSLFNLVLLEAYSGQLYWTWKGLILLLGPQLLIAWCRVSNHVVHVLRSWLTEPWYALKTEYISFQLVFGPPPQALKILEEAYEDPFLRSRFARYGDNTPEEYVQKLGEYYRFDMAMVFCLQRVRELRGYGYFYTGCHFLFILLCLFMNFFPVIQPFLIQYLINYIIFQTF